MESVEDITDYSMKEISKMTFHDVSEKLQHGGTFLFTARSAEFGEDAGKQCSRQESVKNSVLKL